MSKPRVAIFKFTSCSGCQQALLNAEEQLPSLFEAVDIVYFIEGKSDNQPGPYDLAIVEGGVSTPHEIDLVKKMREDSKFVLAIGSCANYGGPQANRNWRNLEELKTASYVHPEWLETLEWATGIDMYVDIDYSANGCGPDPGQLIEAITALLHGKLPSLPQHSVCADCKAKGNICVLVAGGINCLGPVTKTGCGNYNAVCPSGGRGCYGCFGPMSAANPKALGARLEDLGNTRDDIIRSFRKMNSNAPDFRNAAYYYENERTDLSPGQAA